MAQRLNSSRSLIMKWTSFILAVFLAATATECQGRRQLSLLPSGLQRKRVRWTPGRSTSSLDAATHPHSVISSIRGGAALDQKVIAATTAASILTLYGVACALTPTAVLQGYGVAPSKATRKVARDAAVLNCPATFILWCLVYNKTSLNKAVGIASIPFILRCLQTILTQAHKTLGTSIVVEYIGLALSSFVAYATWTNAPYADLAMEGFGLGLLLLGLARFFAPKAATHKADTTRSRRFFPKKTNSGPDTTVFLNRNTGNNLIINGVFFTALALDYDIFKSFASCWFAGGTGMAVMTFLTKDIPKLAPTAVGPTIAWILICYTVATLLVI